MLEVKLLGQFEVLREGKRLTIPTRNAQSLTDVRSWLAYCGRIPARRMRAATCATSCGVYARPLRQMGKSVSPWMT